MNLARTTKHIAKFKLGIVTAPELAHAFLHDLVSEPELDMSFMSSFQLLPDQIRHEFIDLLREIREEDFRWIPFFVASVRVPSDPTVYSAKLRQIYELLGLHRS